MAVCNGLKITGRYSNKEGPCPGNHSCDFAIFNIFLGDNFIGQVDLNNQIDGGDRISTLYATGDDIIEYISKFGCKLVFKIECASYYCHENIIWFKIENDDDDVLLDSCVLDSFDIDCCDGGGGGSTTTTKPVTTTEPPTTTTTTTTKQPTTTTTRKPVTTTTRIPDRCDPSTQPPPIINDPTDAELTTIPSTNSPRNIILINASLPLNSDTILTTTTSTTTSTSTTSINPILISSTLIPLCDVNCNKLGY